ncbi:MAG: AMP-dependent synthetase/ligase [Actinomycetota bacterium]
MRREFSVPVNYLPRPSDNLVDDVYAHAERSPDRAGFARRVDGVWQPVTYRDFADQVTRLAAGFVAAGIRPGDRVALLSATRYEWMLCDFAIWAAAGVTVPVYATSSAEQIDWILRDSGAVAIVVETDDHMAEVESVRPNLPDLRHVWRIDQLDDVTAGGRDVPADDVHARHRAVTSDQLATVIYTSGTTGRPKGCVLTHANLLFGTRNVCTAPGIREQVFNEQTRTLHFLPLAHVLAREIQLAAVHNGVHLAHGDIKNLPPQLVEFRPTTVLAMPRVFERIYNTAKHKAADEGKARIFHLAETTASDYSRSLEGGRRPAPMLRLRHAVLDRLVYGKIRAAVGGEVRYAVSGGAALGERLGHFFRGVGINVLEGYGLTLIFQPGSPCPVCLDRIRRFRARWGQRLRRRLGR